MQYCYDYLIAFASTALLICLLKRPAVQMGLVDHPAPHKHHRVNIPLIGGLAIFCGFVISLLTSDIPLSTLWSFLSASLLLIIIGAIDDVREISPNLRFVAQIVAALVVIHWGGVVLRDLGALTFNGSLLGLGIIAVPVTVFAMVGVINALNMSDGIDGLAASLTLVALLGLVIVTYVSGRFLELQVLLLLASGIVAFLTFNIRFAPSRRASVFLGDSGSMFLGITLAWFTVHLSQGESRAMPPVVALWILMVPLIDTVAIMIRRILKGRSPFRADREHLHHLLLAAGYSVTQTVLIMAGLAIIGVMVGLYGWYLGIPEMWMFAVYLGVAGLHLWGMMHAWDEGRLLGRPIGSQQDASTL